MHAKCIIQKTLPHKVGIFDSTLDHYLAQLVQFLCTDLAQVSKDDGIPLSQYMFMVCGFFDTFLYVEQLFIPKKSLASWTCLQNRFFSIVATLALCTNICLFLTLCIISDF